MKSFFAKYKKSIGLVAMLFLLMITVLTFTSIQQNSSIEDNSASVESKKVKIFLIKPKKGTESLYSIVPYAPNNYESMSTSIVESTLGSDVSVTVASIEDDLVNTGFNSIAELQACNVEQIAANADCVNKMNNFKADWFKKHTDNFCKEEAQIILITPSYLLPSTNFTLGKTQIGNIDHIQNNDCSETVMVASPNFLKIQSSYTDSDREIFRKRVVNTLVVQTKLFKESIIDKFLSSASASAYGFPSIPNCTSASSTTTQSCINYLNSIPKTDAAFTATLKNNSQANINKNFKGYITGGIKSVKIIIDALSQACPNGCSASGGGGGTGGETGTTCPASTQARFILNIDGVSTGLVGTGQTYGVDAVDKFEFQILQNQSTSEFFSGTIKLKLNGTVIETFNGSATTSSLDEYSVGTYTLEGYKGSTLCGSGSIVLEKSSDPGDIEDGTDENGQQTENSQAVSTCQARFSIKLKNKETREPLTDKGIYEISMIDNVSWVVVRNMQTNPPLYHNKKVTLKKPSETAAQTFTGGEPRYIEDFEEGKYVLKAFKGTTLCSKATLNITEDKTVSTCSKFKPVAGFYKSSSGSSIFVKEGEFTSSPTEFKYSVVIPNKNGNVPDTPSTDNKSFFKGKIVLKVDDVVVNEFVRKRGIPRVLPEVTGSKYTVEAYNANTNELCSSSTITFPTALSSTECGALDVDDNQIADVYDLANFARKYNKTCTDSASQYSSLLCGAKDTNADSKVDLVDLSRFGQLYLKPSCDKNQ